ncbi:DNA adenine methylase [Rhizosphaericola mali]|uniref:DNA adenine methylase n=1 Tax=Rhizosphaericola mali TaxID=2545455 RepID=UPI00178679A3|nr:DNA adenine methylase [Rhizosphaericola mali]
MGIFSFWNYITNENARFVETVNNTKVTLDEWQKQRLIFFSTKHPCFELAFATFFLSRTNRSGILGAGPIGGQDPKNQEVAEYKIDCRFKKDLLIEKLQKIGNFRDAISITNYDALDFLKQLKLKNLFVYLDPPYFIQGKALYLNYYRNDDHVLLRNYLNKRKGLKWMLSYDYTPNILDLYKSLELFKLSLNYSAHNVKKGLEVITHSLNTVFPEQYSCNKISISKI